MTPIVKWEGCLETDSIRKPQDFGWEVQCKWFGPSHRSWGLKDWSRYPSAKQRKGRARVWDRNRGLEALPVRGVAPKLHSYIGRRWTYVWTGWGNVPPIPRNPWTNAKDPTGPLWVV